MTNLTSSMSFDPGKLSLCDKTSNVSLFKIYSLPYELLIEGAGLIGFINPSEFISIKSDIPSLSES